MADSVWMVLGLWSLKVTASSAAYCRLFWFLIGLKRSFRWLHGSGWVEHNQLGQRLQIQRLRSGLTLDHTTQTFQDLPYPGGRAKNGRESGRFWAAEWCWVSARVPGAPVNQSSKLTRIRKSQWWKPIFLTFWTWFVSQWWFSGSNYVEFIWEVKNLD